MAEPHALDVPLRVLPIERNSDTARASPTPHSLVSMGNPGIAVATLKPADDGDSTILRLHEGF